MWQLCVDTDGNVLRNPREIEEGWTLEEVEDALCVRAMLERLRAKPAPSS